MTKAKRIITDIILIVLILSSLFMVLRIWFGSYISPEGYKKTMTSLESFIKSPFSWLSKGKANTFSYNMKILLKPEKIVLNQANGRAELTASDSEFYTIRTVSFDFLKDMLLGDAKILQKTTASSDEFYAALKGKSVFINYGNKIDSRLISMSICSNGESEITDDVTELKDILIVLNDNVLNNVSVYFEDLQTKNIVKYIVEYDKEKLDFLVDDYFTNNQSSQMPSYSFELNFHTAHEGSLPRVLFDPTLLLEVTPKETDCIASKRLGGFTDEGRLNESVESDVLRCFEINPMTMRSFTEVSGSTVFVENYGTLAISPEGKIEFVSQTGRNGIALYDEKSEHSFDIYDTTTLAVDFISNLCASFSDDIMENLQINCDLLESKPSQNRYTFRFDYFVDGAPVYIENGGRYDSMIEMTIENGNLINYHQYLRKYYKTGELKSAGTSIGAADKIVENIKEEDLPVYIRRMGTCFLDNDADSFSRLWKFEIDGKLDFYIVR